MGSFFCAEFTSSYMKGCVIMLKRIKGKLLLKVLKTADLYINNGNPNKGLMLLKHAIPLMEPEQLEWFTRQFEDLVEQHSKKIED